MKNEITFDKVKFWLDDNIIHCQFSNRMEKKFIKTEVEDIIIKVLSTLSKGNYKPVLIDLTKVSNINAIYLYALIYRSSKIKSLVISKSFIVKSFGLNLLFKIYSLGNNGVVPIKISTNLINAIQYCNQKYSEFNAI